jgi:hypothetical protein
MPMLALAACGGGKKPAAKKPTQEVEAPPPKVETEEDRQAKRLSQAHEMIPEGSKCLPVKLKDDGAPVLELAAVGADAMVCAVDKDKDRLLGPVGCWKIDLATGGLEYQDPAPLPGLSIDVKLDDHCARGFCLPKEAKVAGSGAAHMSWNIDKTKVAVLVGDDVHIFDAATKAHESSFSIRGDKGLSNDPVGVHFVGDTVFVEGADQGPYSAVWGFKAADGAAQGPINALGGKDEKPVSTWHGSVSVLDKNHIGLSSQGMETLTIFEVDSGKRTKLVRKVPKVSCKPDELDAFWHDGDKVTDKCKDSVMKASGHLMGAQAVMGSKSLLVLLRNDRLGELAVLDAKSLAEKKAIKMPWCSDGDQKAGAAAAADKKEEKTEKKADTKSKKASDPEEGGQ